jgi:hypothetical protein
LVTSAKKPVSDSGGELKFTVTNLVEAYDCINDISKAYKKYGKCWCLYDKIRKSMAKSDEDYKWYSIYVSNYNDKNCEGIIKLLNC